MTSVTILQPAYLPWLGFFDRIQLADQLIVLDHVAIDRNSKTKFANRNRIKLSGGEAAWLTAPILARGAHAGTPLCDIRIQTDQDWVRKHRQSLQAAYARAPYFREYIDGIDAILRPDQERLMDVTEPLNDYFLDVLGIDTPVTYSSAMDPQTAKSDLVLELCRKVSANTYISGPFGRDYLDRDAFANSGIGILFHDYIHPRYPQLHGEFVPYMSIVDLLFNVGNDALPILSSSFEGLAKT